MKTLGKIIKGERGRRKLLLRHVGAALDVDQALISKFERGVRIPTKEQVNRLAKFYDLDKNELMTARLTDKILFEVENEKMALDAMLLATQKIKNSKRKKVRA
jgi:transcriptional regulator with XRE-family HTH domain